MKNNRSHFKLVVFVWGKLPGLVAVSVQNQEQSVLFFFSLCGECAAVHLHSKRQLQECLHSSPSGPTPVTSSLFDFIL